MGVVGLMNMQYAMCGKVYVLEANPRASRTVPLRTKVYNINMANIATKLMTYKLTGERPDVTAFEEKAHPYYGVKEAYSHLICSLRLTLFSTGNAFYR